MSRLKSSHLSKKHKLNISKAKRGKKHNFETKKKISKAHKGKKLSIEHKKKMSKAHKGKKHSLKTRKKMSLTHKGVPSKLKGVKGHPNNKKGKPWPERQEKRHPNWKGGKRSLADKIRSTLKYKIWRQKVFKRDNWTCQNCNKKGCFLEAHHKKSFIKMLRKHNINTVQEALNCKALWKINIAITLCKKCHNLTKKKGYKNEYY